MKVCFITKYPPIQGGVSAQCYWAARGLAERGHQVRIVTNANEVEDVFKIDLATEDLTENGSYRPNFPRVGGSVEVDSTDWPDRRRIYYIPIGNPTVSRLVSRALNAVADGGCEVIFSQYLEPYGVVASIVSAWTGKPYIFKHAGSDLFRLMDVGDLQPCYREVLRRAHRVITGGPAQKVVRAHGVADSQIVTCVRFGVPKVAFNPGAPPADLNHMLANVGSRWARADGDLAPLVEPLEPGLPVLGIYGKLGEQKGTFDLLLAMRLLIDQGFPFHLMVLGRGWQEAEFGEQVARLGLARYVRMHPFVPHWRVPGFIRSCDAVAFLERDFAIRAHTPTIPSEVLSCATCLVISEEVLRKQIFRAGARHRENLLVVADPRDHSELAHALRFALTDVVRARQIGAAGYRLTEELPDITGYVAGLEELLSAVVSEPALVRSRRNPESATEERLDPSVVVERLYPYTTALLGSASQQLARTALAGSRIGSVPTGPREFATAVGARLLDSLAAQSLPHVEDMCRYERQIHAWTSEHDREAEPERPKTVFDLDELGKSGARFCLCGDLAVEVFTYDIEELAQRIVRREAIPDDVSTHFRVEGGLLVLFHRGSFPQRISRATATLIAILHDGALTFCELRARLSDALAVSRHEVGERDLADIMESLFWEGIILVQSSRPRSAEVNSEIRNQKEAVA